MAVDESAEVRPLEALVGVSFPATLSKLSSTSLSIPLKTDFQLLYNLDEFKLPIDEIIKSSQCVLESIGASEQICGKSMRFAGGIEGDNAYDWLVSVNDRIFEKIDASMDEYQIGLDLENWKKMEFDDIKKFDKRGKAKVSFHLPTIKKPQEEYNISVNNENVPFEHVWLEKSEDNLHYIHPLEKLSVLDFVDQDVTERKPFRPLPLEVTPFKLVEEVKDLEDLAAKLRSVEEFAVDLEHNQYRSFQGLTCLMQISTRTEDYIVDTFKLWDYIGPYLREIFADSKKKKVMHGADRDIIWLQRDFGIYVCNLFDTGQASKVLKLERKSLEFLLMHYCGVAANKQYQNADWRIRPLPDVMTRYAREDTHYLLYIYDVMRIDLHTMAKENEQSDSPLIEVYKRSYDVCMQLYEKELFTKNSYLHLYGIQAANFNAVQLSIVAGLYEWRDPIARADDESTGYVLPNKTLFEIAKEMPINVGKLRRLLKSKLPYIDRNIDAVVSVIRRSMQNAAAFEPVYQSLNSRTVFETNVETTIEETGTASLSGSGKVSVDVPNTESCGFRSLVSKRKFESDNKEEEKVKVCKSKANEEIIIVEDETDEDDSEADDGVPDVITTPSGQDIIVLTDSDSDSDSDSGEEEEMSKKNENQGKFMSMKRGFLNI